ncbi:MAG: YraN family protein [Dethiobacteria bacterium]|jgi:putative endonuclease|nr:YraN family protein [Bacillota bacterium]
MSHWRKRLGKQGEIAAKKYLLQKGYCILEENYTCDIGEIDIVAKEREELVFVEVRTKTGAEFGLPEESVDKRKLSKLVKLSYHYLAQFKKTHFKKEQKFRIDLIAVEMDRNTGKLRDLRHLKAIH